MVMSSIQKFTFSVEALPDAPGIAWNSVRHPCLLSLAGCWTSPCFCLHLAVKTWSANIVGISERRNEWCRTRRGKNEKWFCKFLHGLYCTTKGSVGLLEICLWPPKWWFLLNSCQHTSCAEVRSASRRPSPINHRPSALACAWRMHLVASLFLNRTKLSDFPQWRGALFPSSISTATAFV